MTVDDAITFLQKDPALSNIIDVVGKYKLKKRSGHFAVLVESIISQQLATSAADAIFKRFKDLYPKFPTASDILATRKSKLRTVGLSSMKIEYLKDLAKHVEEGRLNMRTISRMSDEDVIIHLTQVKGIGRWTAEMFLIFSLGRQDIFPVGDLALRKGVQMLFSLPEMPKPKEAEKLGQRWKPHRTAATWYLWKSLRQFDKIG
ncbi:3-methyladenine DNA glycosylase/8-oxoguanine DNA glycosylase [Nitrosotalea devaniterrae]|uniref:3-methyladenine DNA glycosylase/8-oxoguanine DNA glycosylase n=1 Tax=Nitrosotalea devaniterrae TaxID=1078905 RepID=A0A128A0B1_9ARCH|nr:3-methyladenine DNA glycosylase/8-oxoguanine DNA glycosylase [Candidatus Nitrosotalea devanaterra]